MATAMATAMGMDTMMSRQEAPMKRIGMVLLLVVLGSGVIGCANLTPTQQRALSGGAIGAAGGAALGAMVGGSPALGAALGGAAGAATGALLSGTSTTRR
jgi:osmotically inducible lipoprotein OsmB